METGVPSIKSEDKDVLVLRHSGLAIARWAFGLDLKAAYPGTRVASALVLGSVVNRGS